MGESIWDGFVEFASANEAEKALEKKNGESLHDHKIFVDVAKKAPYPQRPKYCIDHKVWYGDYLRQESLLIDEDEPIEDEVAARRKMLFVANIPYETKIPNIVYFLQDVREVVSLRLIVDHRGEHVGCGFVEFASVNEAEEVQACREALVESRKPSDSRRRRRRDQTKSGETGVPYDGRMLR